MSVTTQMTQMAQMTQKKGLFGFSPALFLVLSITFCLILLFGCDATQTAVRKRHLNVETRMSSSVFLDPVALDKRRICLQVRNTSDKSELDLQAPIAEALSEKGYVVVADPELAHYILQANVLQVARSDLRAAEYALQQGFGAALTGATLGAAMGTVASDDKQAAVKGGIIGTGIATVGNAMVEDVVYTAIADLQISERVGKSTVVKEKTRSKLKQGNNGTKEITSTEKVDWKRYQARVVSTANKANLKFHQAAPQLAQGLTRSIVGIF